MAHSSPVCLSILEGKAFLSGYMTRLNCFLGLMVFSIEAAEQGGCKRKIEDSTRVEDSRDKKSSLKA